MRPMPDVFISRWLPCIPAFPSAICRLVILPLLPVSSSDNHFWRRHHDSNLPIIRERRSQLIRKQTCLWQTEGKKEQASGSGVHFFIMHIGRTRGGGPFLNCITRDPLTFDNKYRIIKSDNQILTKLSCCHVIMLSCCHVIVLCYVMSS